MPKLMMISFGLVLSACAGSNGLSPATPATVTPSLAAAAHSVVLPAIATPNLYVVNYAGNSVTVYDSSGKNELRTISQGLDVPVALAFDGSGDLYVANYSASTVTVYAKGGGSVLRTISSGVNEPYVLAFDGSGNLYVANLGTNTVTVYAPGSGKVLRTTPKV